MLLLLRILVIAAILAGLSYGALYALGMMVEPEQREITHILPRPPGRP